MRSLGEWNVVDRFALKRNLICYFKLTKQQRANAFIIYNLANNNNEIITMSVGV